MLVLERRLDEKIIIGNDITLMVVDIKGGGKKPSVKIGISAPPGVGVDREEVRQSKVGDVNKSRSSRYRRQVRVAQAIYNQAGGLGAMPPEDFEPFMKLANSAILAAKSVKSCQRETS